MTARIYAQRAHWEDGMHKWIFENGWIRRFNGSAIKEFKSFDVTTTALAGEPPSYFKKEVKQYTEVDYQVVSEND